MKFLDMNEIRRIAPAVFAEGPADHLSAKYQFISTAEAIKVMADQGYGVVEAQQDKQRSRSRMHQRHMLKFRHADDSGVAEVGEYVPQILMINSHNGKTSLTTRLGIYRFVCSNGMVIGNDIMNEQLRHSGSLTDQIIDRLRRAAAHSAQVFSKIDEWRGIQVTTAQAQTYAQRAAELRFGAERAKAFHPDALLEVRREEDEGNSLWRVFNRVQENTTNVAIQGRTALNRVTTARRLTGITENTVYNEALWRLTEEVASVL